MLKKMKVLMLTLFPHTGNGSSTVVRDLATLMSKKHDIRVFYVGREKASFEDYESYFMIVDDFPVLRTHPLSLKMRPFIELSQDEITDYMEKLYQSVFKIVSDFKPDMIHVHHGWLGAVVAMRIKIATGIPYIVQFHGTELEVRKDYQAASSENFDNLEMINREGLKNASFYVAISPTQQKLVQEYLEFVNLPSNVEMIPNGYDEEIFYPMEKNYKFVTEKFARRFKEKSLDENMPIVLFAGRFAGFKGIQYLIRAAKIFGEDNIQTLLCGEGELYDEMVQLSQDIGVNNIHFLGHVDHFDDLPTLYNLADVLVIPSRNEPFGLVAIEAMGCRVPAIVSNSGALPYILDCKDQDTENKELWHTPYGIVVPLENHEAIAKAVKYCIDNNFKKTNGEKIAQYAGGTFSIKTQSDRYEQLYTRSFET